jgi:hypothetical protein
MVSGTAATKVGWVSDPVGTESQPTKIRARYELGP